ncbi:MAG TPA: hypothetical protein VHT28_17215 [Silvibacterium sp.]|jgi:hypothetical protein|nr:hypothetical protein [Silvibacterium sp.]
MADEVELTMNSLLEQVIGGLAMNDAPRLRNLLQMTDKVEAPKQEAQLLQAISRKHLLAAVLNETARNLRLLERLGLRARGGEHTGSYERL